MNKVSKGHGIVRDILTILEGIYFGNFYFEAAVIMRESLLISVLTHNTEVIHNLTEKEVKWLEAVDFKLMKNIFLLDLAVSAVAIE